MAGEWQTMEISYLNIELLEQTATWLITTPPPKLETEGISQSENGRLHLESSCPIPGLTLHHYFNFPVKLVKGGRPKEENTIDLLERWDSHLIGNKAKPRAELFKSYFKANPDLIRSPNIQTRRKRKKNIIRTIDYHRPEDAPKKKKTNNN